MDITVKLPFERSTSKMHLYAVDRNSPEARSLPISNVYIRQSAMNGKLPKEITLTVHIED